MAEIMEYLHGVSGYWRLIGTYFHLSISRVSIVLLNHPGDAKGCMQEAVGTWLSLNYDTETYGKPTC